MNSFYNNERDQRKDGRLEQSQCKIFKIGTRIVFKRKEMDPKCHKHQKRNQICSPSESFVLRQVPLDLKAFDNKQRDNSQNSENENSR